MPSRKETNRLKSANFRSKIGSSSDARAASAQLVRLVRQTPEDSAYNATILSLVDELTALKVPLPEESLRGAWEVAWSDGTMAWRALVARAVQSIAGNCRAGQCFNLETGEALNFAELFDKRCTITAWGRFSTADPKPQGGTRCPARFAVEILAGECLFSGGTRLSLPISGPGSFEVLYADGDVRIFRSASGIAVQVPSDWVRPDGDEATAAGRRGGNR